MDEEFISSDRHRAEVAAMQNEIYRLRKNISEIEADRIAGSTADPHDPFGNPTEYHEYHDNYTEIQPLINAPGYTPEFEPAAHERSGIRKFYAVGGWCNLLRFFFAYSLFRMVLKIIVKVILTSNPQADSTTVSAYIESSSIMYGVNMLIFGLTNVGFAFLGMKLSGQRMTPLLKPKDFRFFNFVQYSFIGFSLWYLSGILGYFSSEVFSAFGIEINSSGNLPVTGIGLAVYALYTCIVAPVTEELFYRGMLLRTFSKSSQRFGIFSTALMFGLGHGNIHQFILGFIVGIFLAHITLKHNSIIPSITVHVVLNTMTVALSMLELTRHEELILVKAQLAAAFVGLMLLLLFRVKDKLPVTTPAQVRRGIPVAMGSLGFMFAAAAHIAVMISNIYNMN